MSVQVTTIMIGVEDVTRSKRFYSEGLGCQVEQDYRDYVKLNLGEGSSSLVIYPREAAAKDAGVPLEGSGYRGVSFHFIVSSNEQVDEVIGKAVAAGGTTVRQPEAVKWGYYGYFADPDGYLWKVATGA